MAVGHQLSSRTAQIAGDPCCCLVRHDVPVRAVLKRLELEPNPSTLPGDLAEFSFLATMVVGPPDMPGEELFNITICSPEWLARASRRVGGIYNARHHLVVNVEDFDVRALEQWLAARVRDVRAGSWAEVGERLGRLGHWEFEDYSA